MTIEVKLVKRSVTYEKDGKKQRGTNLYVQVGDEYVPIEVVFFPNDKCEGRDPAFAGRMAILTAVAEELPLKPAKTSSEANAQKPD